MPSTARDVEWSIADGSGLPAVRPGESHLLRAARERHMQKLQGIAVSPGVAIGEALVMDNEGFRIPRRFVARDAVEDELERLEAGDRRRRRAKSSGNREAVSRELGEQYGAIFAAHLQMLRDPKLRGELESMIRERHYSPEYAVSRALRRYAKVFQTIESSYLAERANDIFDIEKRLLRNLLGRRREELAQLISPVIVLAHNLTPSETANLDREFVRGFVTEIGGPGSHTAIVAEGLEIPAVVGTGPFLTDVSGGDLVIIDGDQGLVILQPDEETLARYRHEAEQNIAAAPRSWRRCASCRPKRPTACASSCWATSSFPTKSTTASAAAATASACTAPSSSTWARRCEPDEEVHFEAYCQVVERDGGPARSSSAPSTWAPTRSRTTPMTTPQPGAGAAQHPPVAEEPAAVPHAVAGRAAGQRAGRRADHVSADHHAAGTAAGQDGAGRRDGRPGRARACRSIARCRWA